MLFGLILTHNLSAVGTAFMALIYLIVNINKLKEKDVLKKLLLNILIIIFLSSFYVLPLLETHFAADYSVYKADKMASQESLEKSSLSLGRLFWTSSKEEQDFEIGLPILVLLFIPLLARGKVLKNNPCKKEYFLFLILGIICTLMATKLFPWGVFSKYLKTMQFTWRMLMFSNFFLSVVAAINIQIVITDYKDIYNVFFAVICILYVLTLKGHIPVTEDIPIFEEYSKVYVSKKENQAIVGMGKGEYLPVKADENREYILEREDEIYALSGRALIQNYNKYDEELIANVTVGEDNTILELPYIYYPGYKVKLDGKKIETFESENGFLAIELDKSSEAQVLSVEYKGTTLMLISKIISILGIALLLAFIYFDMTF